MSVDRKIFPNCTTINVDKPCSIKIYYSGNVTVTQTNIYEEDATEAYQKHNPKLPQDIDEEDLLLKAFFKLHPINVENFVGLKRPEVAKDTVDNDEDGDEESAKIYSGRRTAPKAGETRYAAKKDEDPGNTFLQMERPAGRGVIPESGNAVLEEYYLSEANDLGKKPATPIVPLALDSFESRPCVDVKDYMKDIMTADMMKKFEKPAKKQTVGQTEQQSFKDYVKSLQTFNRKTLSEITKRYFKTFDKLEKISNEMQHEYHTPGHFEELFATHLTLGYEIAVLKNIMQKIKSAMDSGSTDYSDVINYIKSIDN